MDQIDRELAGALAVDPSPEFRARVRARIAAEPAPRAWYLQWRVGVAGAAALSVMSVVIAIAIGRVNVTENARRSTAIAVDDTPPAPAVVDSVPVTAARIAVTRNHRQAPRAGKPDVLVAPSEVRGLRQLAAIVQEGRIAFVFPDEPVSTAAPEPVTDIVIAPIAIAPIDVATSLEPAGNSEGDGQ